MQESDQSYKITCKPKSLIIVFMMISILAIG